jgi:hypothetical protein
MNCKRWELFNVNIYSENLLVHVLHLAGGESAIEEDNFTIGKCI